jgi:hypothetical protein
MENLFLYENELEQRLHERAIERLSRDVGKPAPEIRSVYEPLLGRLKEGARIKEYLVVLVSRKVKDMLRPDRQGERTGVH